MSANANYDISLTEKQSDPKFLIRNAISYLHVHARAYSHHFFLYGLQVQRIFSMAGGGEDDPILVASVRDAKLDAAIHALPCRINFDGIAPVSSYFLPAANKESMCAYVSSMVAFLASYDCNVDHCPFVG